ncbi:carboxypeptidase-like regulatory domain-containing protein [Flavobacterium galactosidilyticum]|uniref:carboxypeptidase-like regulatory domain-containing protein n=1 Tax=Flavobacterium galactosidilyticum TaxID=2893886 RepID=UPI001E6025EF|nr:carboxypeptidase-like regulatory domain-containing protein [Flavobacterium sp. F-340]UFH47658.1 carboxypeptidase-like regulatory domain-containing protein [Flavobacterium sp. F-340]
MKIKITLQLVLFFLVQVTFGQTEKIQEIRGKISADSVAVDRVNVLNLTSEKATVSDASGFFVLPVKTGDILVFSAVNLETLRKKIGLQDLSKEIIIIQMIPKSIILKEVVVNESAISAESLGIIPYGQKKYTPAERKLYTATSGGGIDGLLNAISGRKAMLKKEIAVEKKEQLLARIDVLFEDKYYTETLKIPSEYIKGFQYYCVDDVPFANALSTKNKTLVMFLIVKLAETYNEIIAVENK